MKEPLYSVVIPVFNEEGNLPYLRERLARVAMEFGGRWEFVFVDDGSQDRGLAMLKEYHRSDPRIKIVSFSRNFGHQSAVSAGLAFCAGDCVMVIDADLQDPPEILPDFIRKWEEGYQVVYAVRKKRKEVFYKRIAYYAFYRLLRLLSSVDVPLDAGDFCLMDRRVVSLLNALPERNRFVRGLRSWVGFRQVGIEYDRDKRFSGETKYGWSKLLKLAFDGIVSFSEFPLKLVILLGLLVAAASMLYGTYIVGNRLLHPDIQIPGWSSIVVGISFLGGIQLVVLGILGEYVTRIYDEVKGRPIFIMAEAIGFEDPAKEGGSGAKIIGYHSGLQR